MKIALFADAYKPYISGVTVSIETQAKELGKLGHEVFIFCPAYKGHFERGPKLFRFRSIPTHYPHFRIALPYSHRILPQIPKLGIEIIHSHSPYQMGILARRQARKLDIPFVYTFHTLFTEYLHYVPWVPERLSRFVASAYFRNFCNSCDCVVVPTEKIRDFLLKEKVKSRIEVIPTGIDVDITGQADPKGVREEFGIGHDKKLLVYVGRIGKEKNMHFLFESFPHIFKRYPNCHWLIVGTGPKLEEYKHKVTQLKMEQHITFAGQITPPKLFNYFAAGDLFIFASLTETQGLILAESKACGVPIVAVRAQGVDAMVHDGEDGFLTEHKIGPFVDKVIDLLEDDDMRAQMGRNARANLIKELSSIASAKRMIEVYRSLV